MKCAASVSRCFCVYVQRVYACIIQYLDMVDSSKLNGYKRIDDVLRQIPRADLLTGSPADASAHIIPRYLSQTLSVSNVLHR